MLKKYTIPALRMITVLFLCALYLLRLPPQFKSNGIFLTDEVSFIVICALIFFTFRGQGQHWKYIGLILTITLFMISLLRWWQTAESSWNIVLGLFPFLDASGYYQDAYRLIQGGLFSDFSGRRPLFASFLSILLSLNGRNLQSVLIIFALLNGSAAFLFGLEIRKEFGPLSGAAVIYVTQFFYRPYAGTSLTEQLGLPLGLIALTVLVHSTRTKKKWGYAIGLLLSTFALFVRAGAFFILPTLFFYGIYLYKKDSRDYLRLSIIFTTAIIIPVFLNIQLGRIVASPNSIQFGNFSDTLYGQTVGGKGWTRITQDHPEVANLKEPQRSQEIYHLAYLEIVHNPTNILLASIKSWMTFIAPGISFGYLDIGDKTINQLIQWAAACLVWIGIWLGWKDKSNPVSGLLLAALIGIFLSIPFLPTNDAGMRPYTATIGYIFLPAAYALSKLINHKNRVTSLPDNDKWVFIASIFGLTLLFAITLGAVLIKFTAQPKTIQTIACSQGLVQANIRITRGSYILFVNDDPDHETYVPSVLIKDVLRSFDDFPFGDFARAFRKTKQPALITFVVDEYTGKSIWLIAPPELADSEGRDVSICGEPILDTYPILIARSIQVY
jgi:hypothetical protein